jgi:hypothetical protein
MISRVGVWKRCFAETVKENASSRGLPTFQYLWQLVASTGSVQMWVALHLSGKFRWDGRISSWGFRVAFSLLGLRLFGPGFNIALIYSVFGPCSRLGFLVSTTLMIFCFIRYFHIPIPVTLISQMPIILSSVVNRVPGSEYFDHS